jgi:hypothetical protein
MVNHYVCEVCLKNFKTNQHLNQHKNRKKKCTPVEKPYQQPVFGSDTPPVYRFGGDFPTRAQQWNLDTEMTQKNPFASSGQESGMPFGFPQNATPPFGVEPNTRPPLNMLSNGPDTSSKSLIDLIFSYKTALDHNKKLEIKMADYENRINLLLNENKSLRTKIKNMQELVNINMFDTETPENNSIISEKRDFKFVDFSPLSDFS